MRWSSSQKSTGRVVAIWLVLFLVPIGSAHAVEPLPERFPVYSGDEFNHLFTNAPLPNLGPIGPEPSITGDATIDQRIRDIALDRGYRRRPLPEGPLAVAAGLPIQTEAASAWWALERAAALAGYDLVLASAFRNHAAQRSILLGKLDSFTREAINARLRFVAPPGYSKHHTGYAIDITQRGYGINTFVSSPGYRWISANNYANAKRFGWIPSYPPDATAQGPEPEPWEFTFVGIHTIVCGVAPRDASDRFCDDDASLFTAHIEWLASEGITRGCNPPRNDRFCPDLSVTRGEAAAFLVRALALPAVEASPFTDDDGSVFESDIATLAGAGITRGCNPPENDRFCPDRTMTRGEMAAFLVRALDLPASSENMFEDDDGSEFEPAIQSLATAGITRGCNPPDNTRFCADHPVLREQLAAFLHRALEGS